ncbi:glycosyltransferase family 4 protein [Aureisphaera sp. CAU 1614]|uniref:Glycosyltransferase family 4 protein n=1 Tax=Halomarinibacterium sedimenti TaxID=2857106 RepID=A0A9X1FMV3_9FLAO|nr:glycosyltransferase family 4 protein [Halomarinibacterium sedimenti]MBW2937245.1 glycosyltransferase family 4 protein [Halomarinibacterium sedimenti]
MPKKIAFIGPLPPPVGGVALANLRAQEIIARKVPSYKVINLNTSKKSINADLYKKKGLGEFFHFTKNIFQLIRFVFRHKIFIANVFIVPNISFLREAIFIFILKLKAKKLVVHLHAKTDGDLFLHGFRLKLFTWIISLGDIIFVLSEKHHKAFYSKYINPEKLVVLENFVDYKEFQNEIEDKQPHFLYVGRLSEKKGFETLVDALIIAGELLKDLKIEVLGAFENAEFEERMKSKINDNNLVNFIFHGPQMGEAKFHYFKKCSVFIFPSYFENSPIVLKEAIAAKMAIIASDIIENKNMLDTFNNKVYFKQKNAADLASKLILLHQDKNLVLDMMKHSERIKQYDIPFAEQIILKSLKLK